jgi:hypothetical protein
MGDGGHKGTAQGTRHKAQGHNSNRSIVGRPAPLWSWTRYCLMNREGCGSTAVPSQTSRAWCRHRIIESLNNRTIDISDQVPPRQERRSPPASAAQPCLPSRGRPWSDPPTNKSLEWRRTPLSPPPSPLPTRSTRPSSINAIALPCRPTERVPLQHSMQSLCDRSSLL